MGASPSPLHRGAVKHARVPAGRVEGGREKCANGVKILIHDEAVCSVLYLCCCHGGGEGGLGDYLSGVIQCVPGRRRCVLSGAVPFFSLRYFALLILSKEWSAVFYLERQIDPAFVIIATILQYNNESGGENAAWVGVCGRYFFLCLAVKQALWTVSGTICRF